MIFSRLFKSNRVSSEHDSENDKLSKFRRHKILIQEELESLSSMNEKYFIFLATLDIDTCPICGRLDGKRILIKDAAIGVNCPPMHDGCRCTIITGGLSRNELKNMQRRMRNPETQKSEVIPHMIYEDWKKKYMK